jgi:hypothetical protein
MGCCASGERVLPTPPTGEGGEYEHFQQLLAEDVSAGNARGWVIKKDWPGAYKNDFKMRVYLRKDESGNPNLLLRADGKYRGVQL